ncbi:hypothetical protein J4219_03340 [Candidatus Woesearchaeota archaeon]|nr:hypothetical protein [Candidatus Woesearchaeota archaeon]
MDLLSVDIDDVLFHFVPGLFDWHNNAYPEHVVSHKGLKYYDFREYAHAIGRTRPERAAKIFEYYRSEDFKNIPVVSGAIEGIRRLKERYDLISVTSRPDDIRELTVDSIRREIGDVFRQIVFIDSFDKQKKTKGEVCREQGALVHIDDLIPHLENCASHGVAGILLDRSWNQGAVPNGVIRVYDWNEVPSAVEFVKRHYQK